MLRQRRADEAAGARAAAPWRRRHPRPVVRTSPTDSLERRQRRRWRRGTAPRSCERQARASDCRRGLASSGRGVGSVLRRAPSRFGGRASPPREALMSAEAMRETMHSYAETLRARRLPTLLRRRHPLKVVGTDQRAQGRTQPSGRSALSIRSRLTRDRRSPIWSSTSTARPPRRRSSGRTSASRGNQRNGQRRNAQCLGARCPASLGLGIAARAESRGIARATVFELRGSVHARLSHKPSPLLGTPMDPCHRPALTSSTEP